MYNPFVLYNATGRLTNSNSVVFEKVEFMIKKKLEIYFGLIYIDDTLAINVMIDVLQ